MTNQVSPFHEPDPDLAGGLILPYQIWLAVTIEISRPHKLPVGIGDLPGVEQAHATEDDSIHGPNPDLAGGLILPDQVGLTISVEIISHRGSLYQDLVEERIGVIGDHPDLSGAVRSVG